MKKYGFTLPEEFCFLNQAHNEMREQLIALELTVQNTATVKQFENDQIISEAFNLPKECEHSYAFTSPAGKEFEVPYLNSFDATYVNKLMQGHIEDVSVPLRKCQRPVETRWWTVLTAFAWCIYYRAPIIRLGINKYLTLKSNQSVIIQLWQDAVAMLSNPFLFCHLVFVAEFGHKFYLEEMLWQQRKDEGLSLPPGFHSHAMATRYIMRLKKLSCMESKIFSTFPRTMKAMVSLSQDKRTQMVLIIGNFLTSAKNTLLKHGRRWFQPQLIPFMLGDLTPCEFHGIEVQTNQVIAKKLISLLETVSESEYLAIRQTRCQIPAASVSLCKGKVFWGTAMEKNCPVVNAKYDGYCQRHRSQNPLYSSTTSTTTSSAKLENRLDSSQDRIPNSVQEITVSTDAFASRVFDDLTHDQLESNLKELALKGDLSRPQCSLLKKAMNNGPYSTPSNNQGVEASFKTEKTVKNIHPNIKSSLSSSLHSYKENTVDKGYEQLKGKKRVTKEKLGFTQSAIRETRTENVYDATLKLRHEREERKRKRHEKEGQCLGHLEEEREQKQKRLRVRSVEKLVEKARELQLELSSD